MKPWRSEEGSGAINMVENCKICTKKIRKIKTKWCQILLLMYILVNLDHEGVKAVGSVAVPSFSTNYNLKHIFLLISIIKLQNIMIIMIIDSL